MKINNRDPELAVIKVEELTSQIISNVVNEVVRTVNTDSIITKAKEREGSGGVVWISVLKNKEDNKSDFIYPGKSEAKTVNIPYHSIQTAIDQAKLITPLSEPRSENELTAHMVFVVSDKKHEKSEGDTYKGGRDFIDFPVALPFDLQTEWLEQQKDFESFPEFLKSQDKKLIKVQRGKKPQGQRGPHSEKVLTESLNLKDNIIQIVNLLKKKLELKYGSAAGHKVYELILFTDSDNSFCDGCKSTMRNQQHPDYSCFFSRLLNNELKKQGLITSKKSENLKLLIANTSQELYEQKDEEWHEEDMPKFQDSSIDVKRAAGKVIICEKWHQEYEELSGSEAKPFYTVFGSAGDGTKTIKSESKESDIILPPNCFDQVNSKENTKKSLVSDVPQATTSSPSSSPSNSVAEKSPKRQKVCDSASRS